MPRKKRTRKRTPRSLKKKSRSTKKKPRTLKKKINVSKPKVGDKVKIIIKPYKNDVTEIGIVKKMLTKKEFHTRGHKVMLESGTVGRTVRIIKKK